MSLLTADERKTAAQIRQSMPWAADLAGAPCQWPEHRLSDWPGCSGFGREPACPAVTCPTPEKRSYESRGAARFFAAADGLRPYRCSCGRWHLSSDLRGYNPRGITKHRPPRP